MDLLSGKLFHNRYRLIREVGRGSFGEVWLAKDILIDIEVAIKVYVALDPRGVEEFMSEYKNTYELSHSNLIHAYHFDVCDHRPYLVMSYCSNGSAEDLISKIDETRIWYFIRDVASGISYLHEQEPPLIHQDIKPANILIDSAGHFLITDFGISKRIRNTLRKNSSQISKAGTTSYMAPERFTSNPIPVKANDIWSLGATLYELLTGELPFCGIGGSVLNNEGVSLPELDPKFSSDLNDVVRDCLAKETWERPTAKELLEFAENKINGVDSIRPWLNRKRKNTEDKSAYKSDYIYQTRNDYKHKRKFWKPIAVILVIICCFAYYAFDKISLIRNDKKEYLSIIDEGCDLERNIDVVVIDTNAVYEIAIYQCDSTIKQYNRAIKQYEKAKIIENKYENSLFNSFFEKNVSYMISSTHDKIKMVENKRSIIQNIENKRVAEANRRREQNRKRKETEKKTLGSVVHEDLPQKDMEIPRIEHDFINGHEYVDLGLSVKWATCNVGTSIPHEYGNRYAWGELDIKDIYSSDNCTTYGIRIPDITTDSLHDVARVTWGATWRLPTETEFIELIQKCEFVWTSINNVYGYNVIGPNGNNIFLPAAGYHGKDELYYVGENGHYWSSTPNRRDLKCAQSFFFNVRESKSTNGSLKSLGQSVRPVSE